MAASACARPEEGERGSNVLFQLIQGLFSICELALPQLWCPLFAKSSIHEVLIDKMDI
jgi:hypothetical protein